MTKMETMEQFIKDHDLWELVLETADMWGDREFAIEWVYDLHTMQRNEFDRKYYGSLIILD